MGGQPATSIEFDSQPASRLRVAAALVVCNRDQQPAGG